jgi:hypothetical protein
MDNLPDLVIRHKRIDSHLANSVAWNLKKFIFLGGTKIKRQNKSHKEELYQLPLKSTKEIEIVKQIKLHAEGLIEQGYSVLSVRYHISNINSFYCYIDNKNITLDSSDNVKSAFYKYCEYLYILVQHGKLKQISAFNIASSLCNFFNGCIEELTLIVGNTRIRTPKRSPRMVSRSAEKVSFSDAKAVSNFGYELIQKFNPEHLTSGVLPILVEMKDKEVNITPQVTKKRNVGGDFKKNPGYMAFNNIVSAHLYIFLAFTAQNPAQAFNLKREEFRFSGSGENLEVREYKARRGGEVIFRINKSYLPDFKEYLNFIDKYAAESEFLFPFLQKGKDFRKRVDSDTFNLRRIFRNNGIPDLPLSSLRPFSLNVLSRKSADEQAAADYANHAITTFKNSYELPSLTQAAVHVTKFWDKSDPLINGKPKISLFRSHCTGVPKAVDNASKSLPQPDCMTPTGCINCAHYRDIESFDYVWGLATFKFLMVIESSSYRTNKTKSSNVVIDWINGKLKWFSNSDVPEHKEWVNESEMRIDEGDYHPSWSRKIEKFEV